MRYWSIALLVGMIGGCQAPVHFPPSSLASQAKSAGAFQAYDVRGKGHADFYLFANAEGRVTRLGFDYYNRPQSMEIVDLDLLQRKNFPHLVFILDGFGYDVVKQYYDAGGLRMFHTPSRVVAPYPTLTDLCMEDALGYMPVPSYEAEYYSHQRGQKIGGSSAYLKGVNEPYNRLLQYRANLLWDAIGYVAPWKVFNHELNDAKQVIDRRATQEIMMYFVSSAGVGTREGAAGQRRCLQRVDEFAKQILWETHGQVSMTMLADHGHSYTNSTRVPLEKYLQDHKWKVTENLKNPRDVVYIRFGLVTFISFAAKERQALAADLVNAQGVELASYAEKNAVVVLGKDGQKAIIRHRDNAYSYEALQGDPLKVKLALARLKSSDGFYLDRELFQATLLDEYPAAMQRLWRAHFDLVQDPPDVIVSLEDKYYSGSRGFDAFVNVASTHGSLNRKNSTTFIMSTIAPLPPAMESNHIPENMKAITGVAFPSRK